MEVAEDTLAELLTHSRELYSLPAVVLEVLELANSPKLDTARLSACVERDPALTAKLLRVVNSSLFGLNRRISSVSQALAVLGIKPLKMLVLGFGLPEPLFAGLARDVLDQYWRHTLTRAVAARELSERLWKLPGDERFVVGLLKDLGRLVLIQGLGQPYVEMLRKANWPRDEVRSLERRLIGFDHVQLTAALLKQWGLPETIVKAVDSPDTLETLAALEGEAKTTARILFMAERLAELLADERVVVLKDLLAAAGEEGFDERRLTQIATSLDETVAQLSDVLSLDLPRGLAYGEVLARAYLQLSLIASDAAADLLRMSETGSRLREFADGEEARGLTEAAARFRAGAALHAGAAVAGPTAPTRPSKSATTTTARGPATPAQLTKTATAHACLQAQIASAAAYCRQTYNELSLLFIQLDHDEELLAAHGEQGLLRMCQALMDICRATDPEAEPPLTLDRARLALVLADCDRTAAADVGHALLHEVRRLSGDALPCSISIGASTVAIPAKNFDPSEIVRSAERCLRAAQLSGGNCLKSIEAY